MQGQSSSCVCALCVCTSLTLTWLAHTSLAPTSLDLTLPALTPLTLTLTGPCVTCVCVCARVLHCVCLCVLHLCPRPHARPHHHIPALTPPSLPHPHIIFLMPPCSHFIPSVPFKQLILIHSPVRPRTLALTEDLVLTPSSSYICPHTLAPTPSLMTPYITPMSSPPYMPSYPLKT